MSDQWRKVLIFKPAHKEIAKWPEAVKKELGSVLTLLQKGESVGMPDVRVYGGVKK